MTEDQQSDLVNGLDLAARQLVREVVKGVTSHEFPHVVVKLGDVKIMGGDKGIEAKISAANIGEHREVLGDNVGEWVTVLMVDSAQFMGERARPEIMPDQSDLPLDGPDDSEADEIDTAASEEGDESD